jgi:hypothetical protein
VNLIAATGGKGPERKFHVMIKAVLRRRTDIGDEGIEERILSQNSKAKHATPNQTM